MLSKLNEIINGKNVLITGGTGSFGNAMTKYLLENFKPNKIIILSRDEFKQYKMKKTFNQECMRYFLGDIRDLTRLELAFQNVNIVFHAAALKHVPILEYNPTEAIATNITGTENVIRAAIKNNVEYLMALSTDKCVSPVNLYGATKLCVEKLVINGNNLTNGKTKMSVVRYGNVFGSRGSVIPFFKKLQSENKPLTITDKRMTRFTLTLDEAIKFTLNNLVDMIGGEIFIPKLKSYNIEQLANIISPTKKHEYIGIRPGEKLYENMLAQHESYLTIDNKNRFVIIPYFCIKKRYVEIYGDQFCENGYEYNSENNELINDEELKKLIFCHNDFKNL